MSQNTYLQVWTMPIGASGINWDVTSFQITDRLIPEESFLTVKSAGTATFRMLRKLRDDGMGDGIRLDTYAPFRGQYVAIVPGGGALDMTAARWVGCITDFPTVPLQGRNDELGKVTARELGWVFDSVPIRYLSAYNSTGGVPVSMQEIPSANHQGVYQGQIIGNCLNGYFAANPENCTPDFEGSSSSFWTPYLLINRILLDCKGASDGVAVGNIPAIDIVTPDSAVTTYLNTPIKEIIPLAGQTLGSVIDLMFGAARGLNWRVFPSTTDPTRWQLIVRSSSDVTVGNLPAAPLVNVDLKGFDAALTMAQNGADQYDQVEVWGAPVVCCGTVSFATGTLAKGWTQGQEDAYNAGASASSGYSSLTNDQKISANNLVRSSGYLADVYQRYVVQSAVGGVDLQCSDGSTSGVQYLCPTLSWDGSSLAVGVGSSAPYVPTARINRELPWPAGLPASGTDNRNAYQKATPAYLDPVVIHYDTNMPLSYGQYINLAHQPRGLGMPSPSIGIDNRGLAIRITLAPAHLLSLGIAPWNGTGTTPAVADTQPSSTYAPTSTSVIGLNYTKLQATIAIDSSQHLVVTRKRSGITTARNILRVNRPDMAAWLVRGGTILGWTGITAVDKTASDTFTRNDYPAAQKLCDELAAWAFRQRQGATLSVAVSTPFTVPAWAIPGVVIGTLNEYVQDQTSLVAKWTVAKDPDTKAAVVRTLNTPITTIRQIWGDSPRYEITTSDPQAPASTSLVAGVNPWGNNVSVSMGGTPSNAMARMDKQVREVSRSIKNSIPVDLGAASSATLFAIATIVYGTQYNLPSGTASGVYGLKYKTGLSNRTTFPEAIPTGNLANTFDGLAWCNINGSFAWVICGPFTDAAGISYVANPISAPNGSSIIIYATSVSVNGDGGNKINVYRIYSI